jgi:hypothetical protein
MDFERSDREGSNSGDSNCSGTATAKSNERAASKEKEESSSRGRSSEVGSRDPHAVHIIFFPPYPVRASQQSADRCLRMPVVLIVGAKQHASQTPIRHQIMAPLHAYLPLSTSACCAKKIICRPSIRRADQWQKAAPRQ